MRKTAAFFVLLGLTAGYAPSAAHAQSSNQTFLACPAAPFADCTQARCTKHKDGSYACTCKVRSVASAMVPLNDPALNCFQATGHTLQSRFAPVAALQICDNPKVPWAWCLGFKCTRKGNGTTASCACTAPPASTQRVPYIIVRSHYDKKYCTTAVPPISSAPLNDADSIQAFMGAPPPVVLKPH